MQTTLYKKKKVLTSDVGTKALGPSKAGTGTGSPLSCNKFPIFENFIPAHPWSSYKYKLPNNSPASSVGRAWDS